MYGSCVAHNLVANLGNSEVQLQEATLQLLSAHLSITKDKDGLVSDFASYGVNHENGKVSKLSTLNMTNLLSDQLLDVNLSPLVQALYGKVQDSEVGHAAIHTLTTLHTLLGTHKFTTYLSRLSSGSRERLDKLLLDDNERTNIDVKQNKEKKQIVDVAKWTEVKGNMKNVITKPTTTQGKEKHSNTHHLHHTTPQAKEGQCPHTRRRRRRRRRRCVDSSASSPRYGSGVGVVEAAVMEKIRRP
ncbi:hypothetical protein Pmani_027973, partial [Petrolisthes manimaculis]